MIGTYASAILISAAAVLLGRGICVLSGNEGSTWLSAAVGFGALMVICEAAIGLPGRAWTAVVVLVLSCAAAVWIGVRRRAPWPALGVGIPVSVAILALVSIPFLANGRVGVLGISLLNDTHWHLLMAEGLRRPAIKAVAFGTGYPLGPHAVAAVFAQLLGSDVDKTLTGVLIATPILTGLTALAALTELSGSRRFLVAVLTALPYLAAAWYIQSAFKEPILALMLLGLVVVIQRGRRERFAHPLASLVPGAVLIAGVVYDYSYPGLLWPVAIIACWLALELTVGGAWRHLRSIGRGLRSALPAIGIAGAVVVLLLLPDIKRLHDFWVANGGTGAASGGVAGSPLANLAAPLRTLEGLNIWLSSDFRFVPADALSAGALAGFAVVVLLFAVISALQRGDLAWVGAVLALALIYEYVHRTQTPYVAAKALVIPASLVMLGSGLALMLALERAPWRSLVGLGVGAATVAFAALALYSSYLVLHNAPVGPDDHLNELRALRPVLHGRPTLVLFYDDYFQWELLGEPVSSPVLPSVIPAPVQAAKPWVYGEPLYFTSVNAATLNRFDYVITTRTDAGTPPPPGFRLVGRSRSYEVWQRYSQVPDFSVLPSPGAPGAVLDCRTPSGAQVAKQPGYAMVQQPPRSIPVSPLAPGGSERVPLSLPAGRWDISLQFLSAQAVRARAPGIDVRLPPNLDRPGSLWPVGTVQSTGAPIALELKMSDPDLISSSSQFFAPQSLFAVPAGGARTVPLRAACGRYVDWYVVT